MWGASPRSRRPNRRDNAHVHQEDRPQHRHVPHRTQARRGPMTEREALLRAIIAQPADDVVRLVYADWLDDNGEKDRANFIRMMMEHEKNRHNPRLGRYQAPRFWYSHIKENGLWPWGKSVKISTHRFRVQDRS